VYGLVSKIKKVLLEWLKMAIFTQGF